MRRRGRRSLALLALAICLAPLGPACESGAQIVDYGPPRGSSDVPTNTPIRITFDHAVDKASVGRRFHVLPTAKGEVTWPHPNQLVFVHEPLKTDTDYTVQLDAGYQDVHGHVYSLRHWWPFHTEAAPDLVSMSPAGGEKNVDPAGYLTLTFTREMDLRSLTTALTLSPATPVSLRQDPGDPRRVIVAPQTLLDADQTYLLQVRRDALDVDGNPLRAAAQSVFDTGADRPLRHWVTVLTQSDTDGNGGGVWIVDENRLPRNISGEAADSFSWTPDGQGLLLRVSGGTWESQSLGGVPVALPFAAGWAAALGPGRGYAFLSQGRLSLLDAGHNRVDLATGVGEAAVTANGERLAYTTRSGQATVVMGLDVDLRARYRLAFEPGNVSGLSWSPDGERLAYRMAGSDPTRAEIRVRSLTGNGATLTVAQGEVEVPSWQDASHLIFAATVPSASGSVSRAFRVSALSPAGTLSAGQGMPAGAVGDVRDPRPSPDGHQIAFLTGEGIDQQAWLMNADGTGLVQLTSYDLLAFPYSCVALAWTPS